MTRTVLAIGAHPDDEVLGVGGTLAKHAEAGDDVHTLIVTEGATQQYDDPDMIDQKRSEVEQCARRLGVEHVHHAGLPDMQLDTVPHVELNAVLEEAIDTVEPDLVYTHGSTDVNLDHTAVYESTLVATRPQSGVERVLAYEVPSSTDWTGGENGWFSPSVFIDITDQLETKLHAFDAYESERRSFPHPRSSEAIRARSRSRGVSAGFEAAEAFRLVRAYQSTV
ncbi:PIG-L deacetylase family protein [Natrialbaceae archaeon A-CW1-1]